MKKQSSFSETVPDSADRHGALFDVDEFRSDQIPPPEVPPPGTPRWVRDGVCAGVGDVVGLACELVRQGTS